MQTLFELSQQYLDLAQQELLSFFDNPDFLFLNHFVLLKNPISRKKWEFMKKRIAFTKKISTVLFISRRESLLEDIKKYDWNTVYKKDICIRVRRDLHPFYKEIIAAILFPLKKKKINLDTPTTLIEVYLIHDQVYVCQTLYKVHHDFDDRKAHNRAAQHPSAMHPRITRAMINLALKGKKDALITDPFMGTGGTLLEAHDMGLKSQGDDIDKWMVVRTKINLECFHVNTAKVKQQDATKIKKSIAYVVTDLPYGKMTKNISTHLYKDFFSNLKKILKYRAVICFKDHPKTVQLIKKYFKIHHTFLIPVHQSMTRRIVVLEK
ncbi:hypothetical protein J4410_03865 [Candidatus Woesearchaeota archaeon]|nr:hypothetical protein [Candidatus Woesearchaeota archaeon]